MRSTKYGVGLLGALLVLAISTPGCDSFNAVKNYFLGTDEGPSTQVTPKVKSTGEAAVAAKPELARLQGNVLARVGNWTITVDEFNDRLSALKEVIPEYDINDPEARRLVLDELINQQLLVSGAEQTGLAKQKDIQAAVDEFRRTLIVREVARQLTENISVSDEEALAFYNANKESLVGSAQWHVREIVVDTKEQATGLLSEIFSGSDFAQLAIQHSISETAANGGDLGFITQEPFPQMGAALLSLEPGDVSGVFKGPKGHYIVKLEEKKGGEQIAFEEIKVDIIESQTLLKQQQAILGHLDKLKTNIKIEINEQLM